MQNFISEDFLLESDEAKTLYFNYAKDLPIIDYHSHLPTDLINSNKNFENITQIWLSGDHYKWRAQRAFGIDENYITGPASDKDKFKKWAEVVPYTLRNPLYHWTHMELHNPFGIEKLLDSSTADEIFEVTTSQLQKPQFSPKGLLEHFNVQMVGTTDDPIDDLADHKEILQSDFNTQVLPTFRPDKVFKIGQKVNFKSYISKLGISTHIDIDDLDALLEALQKRVKYFHNHGCKIADHGLSFIPVQKHTKKELDQFFKDAITTDILIDATVEESFTCFVLEKLCTLYHEHGWVQQFHLGALRNNNTRKLSELGADTGYDSIGDFQQASSMTRFFNALEEQGKLCKTIIYNLNPADNAVFAAMAGNFQGEGVKGKIQFGSGWWFLDQLDGMKQQMNTLSNIGLISCFVGMLTDSRSFLSYSRHEYFRRLLCNMFAEDIRKGLLPRDLQWVGKIISDICYYNAKQYFNIG